MAIQCGTKASTMISGVHALLLEKLYAFLWISLLEPIGHPNTGIVVFSANRTPPFSEDGGPHVDVHASC